MDISIFLAQVFGLYFLIAGIAMIVRPRAVETLITSLASREFIFMSGLISLLVGVPLVLLHNVWDGTWHVVVTVIVWITLLKGIARLFIPDMVASLSKKLAQNQSLIRLTIWGMMLVGLYLIYVSFNLTA